MMLAALAVTLMLGTPAFAQFDAAPAESVRQYYTWLGERNFEAAWGKLSPDRRASLGQNYERWARGVGSALSVSVRSVATVAQTPSQATVLVSFDTDAQEGEGIVSRTFEGTWGLVFVEGDWMLDIPTLAKTGERYGASSARQGESPSAVAASEPQPVPIAQAEPSTPVPAPTLVPVPPPAAPLLSEMPTTVSGSGIQKSRPFTLTGGNYSVQWRATSKSSGGCYHGGQIRSLDNPGFFETVANEMVQGSASGETQMYRVRAGQYYADMSSGCDWAITIAPK